MRQNCYSLKSYWKSSIEKYVVMENIRSHGRYRKKMVGQLFKRNTEAWEGGDT